LTAGAYVLINTEVGTEDQVLKMVRKVEHVKEAYTVYGVYDLIIRVESESMESLKAIITEKIRKIELVRSTLTMILM
jgi:DNA-binding Lrp family transcriptional regulator